MSTPAREPASATGGHRRVLPAILLAAALLPACTSPERLTAESLDCAMRDVEIVPSVFARKGSKTAWCATCAGKRYLCATNAERSRTVCKESVEGDGCL